MPVATTRPRLGQDRLASLLEGLAEAVGHGIQRLPLDLEDAAAAGDQAGRSTERGATGFGQRTPRSGSRMEHILLESPLDADTIRKPDRNRPARARADVQGDDGVHFEATVVCEAFAGKMPLARHRMVMPTLGDLMAARSTRWR